MSHAPSQKNGPAVEGKRLPFWRGLDATFALFGIGAVVMFAAAGNHVVDIVRGDRDVFSLATAAYIVGVIVALIVVGVFRMQLKSIVIDSACPRCGVRGVRSFGALDDPDPIPPACGSCIAYLRTDGVTVREEPASASHSIPWFTVKAERYVPALQRDAKGKVSLAMPHVCAVCGEAGPRAHREVAKPAPTDFGIVGSVAELAVRSQRAGSSMSGWGSYRSSLPRDENDLTGMQFPVCGRHEPADGDGMRYESDQLSIQNYGFYTQFLALNRIDGPVGQLTPKP